MTRRTFAMLSTVVTPVLPGRGLRDRRDRHRRSDTAHTAQKIYMARGIAYTMPDGSLYA